jgi:hypothetical protein
VLAILNRAEVGARRAEHVSVEDPAAGAAGGGRRAAGGGRAVERVTRGRGVGAEE